MKNRFDEEKYVILWIIVPDSLSQWKYHQTTFPGCVVSLGRCRPELAKYFLKPLINNQLLFKVICDDNFFK
jgi:hypothetical protein